MAVGLEATGDKTRRYGETLGGIATCLEVYDIHVGKAGLLIVARA